MSVASETVIIQAESRLRQAMLGSDLASLDRLISGDLLFTNHLGQLLSKQADLSAHGSGLLKFTKLEPSEQAVVVHDQFAVVSVKMRTEGVYANELFSASIRYTRVWAPASSESWHVVAGHSSLVPEG
ncbi:nuclear transport factor 2 family protein [Rhodoferax sp.]|uniref:nuclear transport factor 2 family protein n=1 Tax=Rhodoferax sp. TaxID=50421 RepID=UPI002ACD315C|nr:nuclear transport factor 2 family protein [Rhodoferax sp.]MDZ7920241.1 nuclear transport factor 2 family protein [Rhodoferax sp.]